MKDTSVELWLAALQERLNEDVRSRLPSLDKELLALKLTNLAHQVRGPSDTPLGMKVHRLELTVVRRQNRRYSGGRWIIESDSDADYFELRVTNDKWDVIMSMEARMDDHVAMLRLFQFIKTTRMAVLTFKFSAEIYTGKLRSHLLPVLESKHLKCVEIYGTTIPDLLMDFAAMVSKNQRRCYFTSLSILGLPDYYTSDHDDGHPLLSTDTAQKIAAMLQHLHLKVLTVDGVCITDESAAISLADGIHCCQSLESLNVSVVNLHVQPIIGQCILQNEALMHLKLTA